ncbi:MAG: DNA polymerase III subunit delta, partial [Thermodesulfobacteriota bacterium]|nr:DNA polymerase III subunit delta [Thermodesulfobacteriota bacterium]
MNSFELTRHLEKEEIRPFYYLHGDETYLIEDALKNIEKKIITPDLKDFNYEIFYGGNDTASQMISAAQTVPVMSKKRCIVIKHADKLSSEDLKQFTSYISKPSSFSCLVFISEKIDERKKFFADFKKRGVIVQLNHPRERDLPYWVRRLAERFNKKISNDALSFFIEIVGNNLQEIHNEIEKVSIFIGDKESIDIKDVEAVVTDVKVENIFDLIDSVGDRDTEKALNILQKMLVSGEDHLKIFGMIIYRFRLILRAKEMLLQGIAPPEVGNRLKMRTFLLKRLIGQANRFSMDELKLVFDRFLDTDLALKSS